MHKKKSIYLFIFVFIYIYIYTFRCGHFDLDFLGSQDLSRFRKLIHWSYFALQGPPRFWLLLKDFNQTHVQKLRTPACPGAFKGFCHHVIWRYNQNGNKPNQQSPVSRNVSINMVHTGSGFQKKSPVWNGAVLLLLFWVTWWTPDSLYLTCDGEHGFRTCGCFKRPFFGQHVLFWGWFLCP